MIKRNLRIWILTSVAACFALCLILAGCGGGGGSSNPVGNPTEPGISDVATARFHVDVNTRQVTVTPLTHVTQTASNRAIFNGSAVGFSTSDLVDEAGDTGRKALQVRIVNQRKEVIGSPGNSLKVIFSAFSNVGAFSDLRPKVRVGTFAGTGSSGNTDGPAASATFNTPNGVGADQVAADMDGAVYVADIGAHKIRKIKRGMVSTFAGSGTASSVDGLGAAATFNQPYGVALKSDGSLIVTEFSGNRIRRIDPNGRVTLVAGTGAAGDADGYGTTATFRNPTGVATDAYGNIYIAESGGHRIRKITGGYTPDSADSYYVATLAGSGTAGYKNAIGTAAQFNTPRGITVNRDSSLLLVADSANNRIRLVTTAGGDVTTIAGTGTGGTADGTGATATFNAPSGIIGVGESSAIVTDRSGHTVRALLLKPGGSPDNPASWLVKSLAGLGGTTGNVDGTGDAARFNTPLLVAADRSANLYIADSVNHKIRVIREINHIVLQGLETGSAPAEPVQVWNADGIIPNQNLPYIQYTTPIGAGGMSSPQNWVFIVPSGVTAFEFMVTVEANSEVGAPPEAASGAGSPNVQVRTYVGGGSAGFLDGVAAQARFNGMLDAAVDASGILFIADSSNHSIRRVDTSGKVTTIAGVVGTGNGSTDGTGDKAKFFNPRGIAVSADGFRIVVADSSNHTIRYIYLPLPFTNDPTDPGNWIVTTIAGIAGAPGKEDGVGNVATFNNPWDVALDASGNVYVTETTGNRVRRLQFKGGDPSSNTSWQVSLVAGDNAAAAGASGTTDATGAAARFNSPRGITVDRVGILYIADRNNHRIRKITPDKVVTTLAGSSSGYTDETGTAAKFNSPSGVGADAAGFIYVADSGNNRVRRISPSGVVTTVAGTAAAGATDGTGNIAQFSNPRAAVADGSGNLYIPDGVNGERVRLIQRVISVGTNTPPF